MLGLRDFGLVLPRFLHILDRLVRSYVRMGGSLGRILAFPNQAGFSLEQASRSIKKLGDRLVLWTFLALRIN